MSGFIVHNLPGSPFGRAVLATLEEKGACWRQVPVATSAMRQPHHLRRHPFGRIPTLDHDGFVLYETQAILRYIDRVCPEPALTPADPRQAARMDQVIAATDWYLFNGVANVIAFQRLIRPLFRGEAPNEEAIGAVLAKGQRAFEVFAQMIGERPFMAGDALTLADLHLGSQMSLLSQTPEWERLGAPHRTLCDWLGRLEARPSFQATTWDRLAAAS